MWNPAPSNGKITIPVPTGWQAMVEDYGRILYLEGPDGLAAKFTLTVAGKLFPYAIQYEVREHGPNKVKRRKGYRRVSRGVLEWLVNQK